MGDLSPDCYACRGVGYVKPGMGVGAPAFGTIASPAPMAGGYPPAYGAPYGAYPPTVPPVITPTVVPPAYPPAYGAPYAGAYGPY